MHRRVVGCWVDHVLAVAKRLGAAAAFALVLAAPAHATAPANGHYTSRAAAYAACQAKLPEYTAANPKALCVFYTDYPQAGYDGYALQTQTGSRFVYGAAGPYDVPNTAPDINTDPAAPQDPCRASNVPHGAMAYSGRILTGSSICVPSNPDPSTGASTQCASKLTILAPPTMNAWGKWSTYGDLEPTGSTCDPNGGGGGMNNWKNPDGTANGQAVPPTPPAPGTTPPTPPKACGGGSCYDPNTDQYCATGAGGQICVPGGSARGDKGGANAGLPSGTAAGACATGGDSAVCAGVSAAPTPPANVIPDPPTAITGSDSYTQANPVTGSNATVVVTSYTNQGATPTTSGQGAGDSGPAPSSSSGSGSGYGGGGDCGSPPVCTGDAVMCGIARQEWQTMCSAKKGTDQLHKDLAGDGPPSDLDALKTKYGPGDVWTDTPPTGDGGAGDAANAGNYDQSGFGYSATCPLKDLTVSAGRLGSFVVPFSNGCVVGDWVRGMILAMALYGAWLITKGAGMKGVG